MIDVRPIVDALMPLDDITTPEEYRSAAVILAAGAVALIIVSALTIWWGLTYC